MTFHASLSLVTCPTLSPFVNTSNNFSSCFPLIIQVVTRYSCFFLLITWPKKVAWHLPFLFMNYLVVLASCVTVSCNFFAIHEVPSILCRSHICVTSSFFCMCFEVVKALHHTSEWLQYSTTRIFLCESR